MRAEAAPAGGSKHLARPSTRQTGAREADAAAGDAAEAVGSRTGARSSLGEVGGWRSGSSRGGREFDPLSRALALLLSAFAETTRRMLHGRCPPSLRTLLRPLAAATAVPLPEIRRQKTHPSRLALPTSLAAGPSCRGRVCHRLLSIALLAPAAPGKLSSRSAEQSSSAHTPSTTIA